MLARGIYKSYGGKEILSAVSLQNGYNQRAALVRHNGAGKSTLLKILTGVNSPNRKSQSN